MATSDIALVPYLPGEDFERWRKKLEQHFTARNIQDPEQKKAWLLIKIGDLADVYEALPEPSGTAADSYSKCVAQLSA